MEFGLNRALAIMLRYLALLARNTFCGSLLKPGGELFPGKWVPCLDLVIPAPVLSRRPTFSGWPRRPACTLPIGNSREGERGRFRLSGRGKFQVAPATPSWVLDLLGTLLSLPVENLARDMFD
jgi:hypothetical protein